MVLPESADDVGKIATNGGFIVASLINHGTDAEEGPGAVIVYKKRNNGLFSYLQTIEAPISTIEILQDTNLDFGIDIEITNDNLIITNQFTLASTDSHSYIAIYEFGEFYWELVQEIYNDTLLNEKSLYSNSQTSIYGGKDSLVADENNLFFKSYILDEDSVDGTFGFLVAPKIVGTFVIDYENPIKHPQEMREETIKSVIYDKSHHIFGDPKLQDYLIIPSVEFIDQITFVPSVIIYQRNEQGQFVYSQMLSYPVDQKLVSLDNPISHSVMIAGTHLIIRGNDDIVLNNGQKLPDAYYELDEDDNVWKVSTDESFDVFNNKLYLGGCPVCHGDEPECKDVKLHLQLTNDITEISDVCLDGVTYSDGCEAEYLLIQPKNGDVSVIDYGSGSRIITPKGNAGITSITNICDVTDPTPTPTPVAQQDPTPTPIEFSTKIGKFYRGELNGSLSEIESPIVKLDELTDWGDQMDILKNSKRPYMNYYHTAGHYPGWRTTSGWNHILPSKLKSGTFYTHSNTEIGRITNASMYFDFDSHNNGSVEANPKSFGEQLVAGNSRVNIKLHKITENDENGKLKWTTNAYDPDAWSNKTNQNWTIWPGGSFVCRDKNGIAYRPLDPDSTEDVENYSWGNDAFANAWMIELYASDPYDGNSYLRFLIKNNQNFINTSSWDEITYDKVFDSEQNTPFNVSVVSFDKNTHPAELENFGYCQLTEQN